MAAVGAIMTSGVTPTCVSSGPPLSALVAEELPFAPPGAGPPSSRVTDGDEAAAEADMAM